MIEREDFGRRVFYVISEVNSIPGTLFRKQREANGMNYREEVQ
jgi:hypothetical protein